MLTVLISTAYSETRLLRTLKGNEKKARSKQSTFYPKQRKGKKVRLAMSVINGENVITECTYQLSFTVHVILLRLYKNFK